MAHAELAAMPKEIPKVVVVTQRTGARFTPNQMRALKAETGKTMDQLFGEDADDGDKMQTLAWLGLRRLGIEIPWGDCGDIDIEFRQDEPDPTKSEPSESSPGSAASGG